MPKNSAEWKKAPRVLCQSGQAAGQPAGQLGRKLAKLDKRPATTVIARVANRSMGHALSFKKCQSEMVAKSRNLTRFRPGKCSVPLQRAPAVRLSRKQRKTRLLKAVTTKSSCDSYKTILVTLVPHTNSFIYTFYFVF